MPTDNASHLTTFPLGRPLCKVDIQQADLLSSGAPAGEEAGGSACADCPRPAHQRCSLPLCVQRAVCHSWVWGDQDLALAQQAGTAKSQRAQPGLPVYCVRTGEGLPSQ